MKFLAAATPKKIIDQTIEHYQHKVRASKATKIANYYAGNWSFTDDKTHKIHTLQITPNLLIQIDYKPLSGQVIQLTEQELIFLDHFGYELRIGCDQQRPIKIYDEAEDKEYPIK